MKRTLVQFTQNIINDTDLDHLTVKDLRNVVINLQAVEEEEDGEELDESRFVI